MIENCIKLKYITKIKKKRKREEEGKRNIWLRNAKNMKKYKMLQHMNPIPSDTLFSANVSAVSSGIKFETT